MPLPPHILILRERQFQTIPECWSKNLHETSKPGTRRHQRIYIKWSALERREARRPCYSSRRKLVSLMCLSHLNHDFYLQAVMPLNPCMYQESVRSDLHFGQVFPEFAFQNTLNSLQEPLVTEFNLLLQNSKFAFQNTVNSLQEPLVTEFFQVLMESKKCMPKGVFISKISIPLYCVGLL